MTISGIVTVAQAEKIMNRPLRSYSRLLSGVDTVLMPEENIEEMIEQAEDIVFSFTGELTTTNVTRIGKSALKYAVKAIIRNELIDLKIELDGEKVSEAEIKEEVQKLLAGLNIQQAVKGMNTPYYGYGYGMWRNYYP
jgi:hypothetical protein